MQSKNYIHITNSRTIQTEGYENELDILSSLIHAFTLAYYNEIKKDNIKTHSLGTKAEELCYDSYKLLLNNCQKYHDVNFYANRLCITPNYLAIILRHYAKESPKGAIRR